MILMKNILALVVKLFFLHNFDEAQLNWRGFYKNIQDNSIKLKQDQNSIRDSSLSRIWC